MPIPICWPGSLLGGSGLPPALPRLQAGWAGPRSPTSGLSPPASAVEGEAKQPGAPVWVRGLDPRTGQDPRAALSAKSTAGMLASWSLQVPGLNPGRSNSGSPDCTSKKLSSDPRLRARPARPPRSHGALGVGLGAWAPSRRPHAPALLPD